MNSEAFLSLYLEEIGVQAPISSFLVDSNKDTPVVEPVIAEQQQVAVQTVEYVSPMPPVVQADIEAFVAEAEPVPLHVQPPELNQPVQLEPNDQPTPIKIEPEPVITPVNDLNALQTQAEACKACELHSSRNQLVFGCGSDSADLVFIGDAPGRDEDLAGQPFVGRSGELFDRMLASIQLNRESVYLMNGVKCRPQHSRDPKPEEFAACERWLVAQLEMLQPKLICMLGRVVAESLLKNELPLSELRAGQFTFRGIPVLVIDHPSYLLRSQKHKRRAWQDLNRLKDSYQKLQSV